ncbi:MAG: hypothetical protein GC160_00195 [Acidobacteria bacterium]|nr:hypothetical protein [Acidobacteriota bacterium]
MRLRCLAVGLLLTTALSAAERPSIPARLTLREALSIALDRSPALRLAAARERQAEGETQLARSELMPHLGVTVSQASMTRNLAVLGLTDKTLGGRDVQSRVGPFGVFDARVAVTQDVFDLSERRQYKAAGQRREAAVAGSLDVREELTYKVVTAYIDALRAQASSATLRKQMALARQLHTITVDRLEQGVASRLDERRALQQTHNLQQLLLEAESMAETAKLQLSAVIHAKPTAEYELADVHLFYDVASIEPQEVVGKALAARPDAKAAAARLRAAETDRKAAQAISLPRVSFYADYGQSGNQLYANLNTYTVRGQVGVPIYFGGRASAERQRAQAGVDAAAAELEQIQAEIEAEALAGAAQVESARRQVEVASEGVSLAEEEIDLTTARFTSGAADNTELLAAQDRLARAEENRIRALYRLNLARAALHRATGQAEQTYRN